MTSHRRSIRLLRLFAILSTIIATIVLASCSDEPDIYTVKTEITSDGAVIRTPRLVTAGEARRRAGAGGPRAVARVVTYDFGRMDPLSTNEYTFVLQNQGDAPLHLEKGPTTCKCTLSKLSRNDLAPGQSAQVVVSWKTGRDSLYRQSASIFTNDPRNKVISLTVLGQVRALLRGADEELVVPRLPAGGTTRVSTVFYSQAWDDLVIDKVEPGREGLQWSLETVKPGQLEQWNARSAVRLSLTVPSDLPVGWFTIPVRVTGRSAGLSKTDPDASQDCEVLLKGKVLRRLALYGPEIDIEGIVHLGRWQAGNSRQAHLLVKVRDEHRDLELQHIQVTPDFVNVRFTPFAEEGTKKGLYHLDIDVPATSPSFRLPPGKYGHLRCQFDHPRISELNLKIEMIITSKGSRMTDRLNRSAAE